MYAVLYSFLLSNKGTRPGIGRMGLVDYIDPSTQQILISSTPNVRKAMLTSVE